MDINHTIKWEEVTITNDFMFGKVMRNAEICKKLIETILDIEIDHIEYPEEQKTIDISVEARGVRLDVYVKDGAGSVYDIEMQASMTKELPKRSRYYQAMMDLNLIEKGATYDELNKSYVIFICSFDPFGIGRHIYTFQNRCTQDNNLLLQDETTKIFLNAAGTENDVDGDLKCFLDYVASSSVTGSFAELINQEVIRCRENKEWRREYMTLAMRDQLNIKKGREEGHAQGLAEGLEKGMEKGQISSLKNMIAKLGLSPEEAMRVLEIPLSEQEKYKRML